MATTRKTAVIYVEVGADKKQVKLEDIQKAVKAVEEYHPVNTLTIPNAFSPTRQLLQAGRLATFIKIAN